MNLILFGATGMVGSGVLREALADPEVEAVLSIGRVPGHCPDVRAARALDAARRPGAGRPLHPRIRGHQPPRA